ncbi:MAG: ParB N-terminal domain-containing protein [bacterium]|nr:MAG: ParB N-terminal domain-containing protein [bacterium]
MATDRFLIHIDPTMLDYSTGAPLRFRRHLPGDEGESKADRELTASVGRFGVIQPPILVGSPAAQAKSYLVVHGHRRLAAARAAGLGLIEAILSPEVSISQEEILTRWLEEVPSGTPLSELELIILSKKAADFARRKYTEERVPANTTVRKRGRHAGREPDARSRSATSPHPLLSKAFEKKLSQPYLERLWGLLELDDGTLEALHTGKVSTGDLLLLTGEPSINVTEAVHLLCREQLNRREQKEAVHLMLHLVNRGESEWRDFLDRYRRGGPALIESLRTACYPNLTNDLERIEKIVQSMQLPPAVSVHPSEHLEGGHYRIELRLRREEEIKITLEKLRIASETGKFTRLLEILRGEERSDGEGLP